MKRYTKLFTNGQAYIRISMIRLSPSEKEVVGEPIQRLALYEASGYEPAEILMKMRELEEYRAIGHTPEHLARIVKGMPAPPAYGCPGQLALEQSSEKRAK